MAIALARLDEADALQASVVRAFVLRALIVQVLVFKEGSRHVGSFLSGRIVFDDHDGEAAFGPLQRQRLQCPL